MMSEKQSYLEKVINGDIEPNWCVFGQGYCNECLECAIQNEEIQITDELIEDE